MFPTLCVIFLRWKSKCGPNMDVTRGLKLNLESLLLLGCKRGWIVFTCLRHKLWNRALTFVQHPVLQTDTARYSNLICDGDVFVHHLICSCSYRLADSNKHGRIRADRPLPAETCLFEKYYVHTCELVLTWQKTTHDQNDNLEFCVFFVWCVALKAKHFLWKLWNLWILDHLDHLDSWM